MNEILLNGSIDEDILEQFVHALQAANGCKVVISHSYKVECEDAKTAAIIQTVFGGNGHAPTKAGKKTKKMKPAAEPAEKGEKRTREELPYEVLSGPQQGMKVKGGALGNMIKAGSLGENVRLRHPNKGDFVITPTRKMIPIQVEAA